MAPSPAPPAHRTASAPAFAKRIEDDELKLFRYVLVGDLGKGSFATVYKGYHEVRPTLSSLLPPLQGVGAASSTAGTT